MTVFPLNLEAELWGLFSVMWLVFNCKLTCLEMEAAIFQASLLLHSFKLLPARYSKKTKRRIVFGTTEVCVFLVFNIY